MKIHKFSFGLIFIIYLGRSGQTTARWSLIQSGPRIDFSTRPSNAWCKNEIFSSWCLNRAALRASNFSPDLECIYQAVLRLWCWKSVSLSYLDLNLLCSLPESSLQCLCGVLVTDENGVTSKPASFESMDECKVISDESELNHDFVQKCLVRESSNESRSHGFLFLQN